MADVARETPHQVLDEAAVGYRTVGEAAYQAIKEAINTGALGPGERLRQEILAEALGVSRVPVRSALIRLESEGLVTFHPRRGAVVRSLSAAQVTEIYQLRGVLERHALRLAVTSITPARVARLRTLAKRVDRELEGGDFFAVRSEFYRLLYDAERNPILVKLIDELRAMVGSHVLGLRVVGRHGHRELVERVARGDADDALSWLDEHLGSVRDAVVALVADDALAEAGR